MEPVPAPQPQSFIPSNIKYRPYIKFILLIILAILLAVLVALGINYFLPSKDSLTTQQTPTQLTSEPTIKESELPIGLSILKNPAVYQWNGSVEGTLVAKDARSITIKDKSGATITIVVDPEGTRFFSQTSISRPIGEQYVPLEKIPLGAHLRGSFFVIPKEGDKNRIVGSSFTYLDKNP